MNLPAMFSTFQNGEFRFAAPYFLLALFLLPFLLVLSRHREKRRSATLLFSNVALLKRAGARQSAVWRTALAVLRMLALALMLIAMARPQYGRVERQTYSEGIDIALVLDVSLSMRAPDFYPNRLEAAKDVMREFVDGRVGDRIGLIIFGSEAVALVPMTLDYSVVKSFIERVQFELVDGNSTAIGMGLATALNKLKDSKAKSKVIILLTDGENNAGKIDPLTAAEAAKTSKVRVYTIGVGSSSSGRSAIFQQQEAGLDEKSLTKIAELTGGLYFRATDREKLQNIYEQIDKLEKSRVESTQFDNFNDLSAYFVIPAMLLIFGELLLRSTRFVKVP
jgi:Ca-activated chloride channel family protein